MPTATTASGTPFAYLELTKPRITLMVVLTSLVGFAMATPNGVDAGAAMAAAAGTALVAAGASALNMLLERHTDRRMLRTRDRPLPSGRLQPQDAMVFGSALSVLGLAELAWLSGWAAAAVAFVTWASYLFVYTPLKTRTSLSTVVGAIPGALPPVIGWAAATGGLAPGAFVLFAIIFLWQIPHFLAIAWLYREDYARGGLPMLPASDSDGSMTSRQILANSVGLLFVSFAPYVAGMAGTLYLLGATLTGGLMVVAAIRWAIARSARAARALFLVSLLYLPALSITLLLSATG